MNRISSVDAGWILDSRGIPTVEVAVTLTDGSGGRASAPSGMSTGAYESVELRDRDPTLWGGKGVEMALRAVREVIAPALVDKDPREQSNIDSILVALDGTPDRSHLGANSMLAVSVACARAGAAAMERPLWRHLARHRPSIPLPMVNVLSGNLHAPGGMDIQDVLIIPIGAPDFATALAWVCTIYRTTHQLLTNMGVPTLVGDEGGFGWTASTSDAAIRLITEAIGDSGLAPGKDVGIALDIAATHLKMNNGYRLDGAILSTADLVTVYKQWTEQFPITSLEDPFGEDAWEDWAILHRALAPTVQLLGDDLIATHERRLSEAAAKHAANAVLIKVNQIGTITEAMDVVDAARRHGWRAVVSARSGETEDDWLADFAVASGAGQIKVGSVARSERLAKYNRLLRITREAGAPEYAGGGQSLPAVS